jgi:hypothetical protein
MAGAAPLSSQTESAGSLPVRCGAGHGNGNDRVTTKRNRSARFLFVSMLTEFLVLTRSAPDAGPDTGRLGTGRTASCP